MRSLWMRPAAGYMASLLLFDAKMFYLTLEAGLYMTWAIEVKQSRQKDGSTTSGTGLRYTYDDLKKHRVGWNNLE